MAALMQMLMEELVEEILLRLPPEDIASLLRASLVCKIWQRILSGRSFRRRYSEFHQKPPMLGFICNVFSVNHGYIARFVPTAPSSLSHANRPGWRAVNAHHGLVLLNRMPRHYSPRDNEFMVWDPMIGEQWELPKLPLDSVPSYKKPSVWNMSMLCAAGTTCNNLRCHPGGPFLVVFVGFNFNHSKMFTCVYSSQAGTWNHLNSFDRTVPLAPSVLAGNALYLSFPNTSYVEVLKYNTDTHGIDREHDGPDRDARWEQSRVIELETLLPAADDRCLTSTDMIMLGFTEGANVIYLRRNSTLFTFDLKSNLATKVYEAREIYNAVPYMAFYTPALGVASTSQ
ncbi:hypothetical protein PR202_ga28586 [Eleusine coracana subsp. coracana]|uniref:F-box domain-containing protein n=1 Tax=Eleusine coracana subsp. coracana TaxID=191504 RepID=A0AAV5DIX1_ELECO|nr:hypothetical protein PR202_ga28586 [Eleusine coracana subsp. coracana]